VAGVVHVEAVQRHRRAYVDAQLLHHLVHLPAHVRVEGRHRLRRPGQHGDGQATVDHRLGHLDADVPTADHHRPARRARQLVEQPLTVVQRLHAVDAFGVVPRHVGPARPGPGGEHQVVEPQPVRRSALVVAHLDLAPVQVESRGLGAHTQVDAVRPVLLRRTTHQPVDRVDVAADPVRDAARGVRRVVAALQRHHLEVALQPLRLRRRRHPGRVPAHHDDPLAHGRETTAATSTGSSS
jgi:hypothetical protein